MINILNLSLTRRNQDVPRLEPQPLTQRYIAKRLVYWAKVEHEKTVKNLNVTHEIHFTIPVYSSTILIQLFLSFRQFKIHPIFENPFLYFGLYLVYLRCHFLTSFYLINNTSLNKLPVWDIDGTTVVKFIWFLDNTNLQTLSVKIKIMLLVDSDMIKHVVRSNIFNILRSN